MSGGKQLFFDRLFAEERITKTGAYVGWTEMIDHLAFLVQNTGCTSDQLKKRLKSLKESGL